MREISKIGENAQIDAIVVMHLRLISDAKRNLIDRKNEHASAIRAMLIIQVANWAKFTKLSDRIDAWLRDEADVRHRPCSDDTCGTIGRDRDRDSAAVAAATEYFAD